MCFDVDVSPAPQRSDDQPARRTMMSDFTRTSHIVTTRNSVKNGGDPMEDVSSYFDLAASHYPGYPILVVPTRYRLVSGRRERDGKLVTDPELVLSEFLVIVQKKK